MKNLLLLSFICTVFISCTNSQQDSSQTQSSNSKNEPSITLTNPDKNDYSFTDSQGQNDLLLNDKKDMEIYISPDIYKEDNQLICKEFTLKSGVISSDQNLFITFEFQTGEKCKEKFVRMYKTDDFGTLTLRQNLKSQISTVPVSKIMVECGDKFTVQTMSNPKYFIELFETMKNFTFKEKL